MEEIKKVCCYEDFVERLLDSGFSMGGGNSEGIYSVIDWDWCQEPPYETPVRWHTGERETDPWEWRMRVLEERNDIAYGKLFFRKSGYITKQWYPHFLKVRREGMTFEEKYREGLMSQMARRIYGVFNEQKVLPLHSIKELAGITKEEKSKFDRALVELQSGMFLTMCGRQQKKTRLGEEYGWSSTVFTTVEEFWGSEVIRDADRISRREAVEEITDQILILNPQAQEKKILKFIQG